jgi:predicted DNA repair protein MutK
VLIGISLLMTVGVYGLVAGIVKLDDGGIALTRSSSTALQAIGRAILVAAPWLMKGLSIAGTAAMFLVGGGILTHGIPVLQHLSDAALVGVTKPLAMLGSLLFDGFVGMLAGAIVVAVVTLVKKWRGRNKRASVTH